MLFALIARVETFAFKLNFVILSKILGGNVLYIR